MTNKTYAKGGKIAGQYVDLFEFYGLQPPALKKVVEKYMDKYIEGEMDYSDTAEFEREVEKLGYTFDSGLDNEPYGLRPIGVQLNQLKGFEEFEEGGRVSQDEYYLKMKEARSSGFDNPFLGKTLVKTTRDLSVDDVGMDIPEGTEGYIFYEPRDAEDVVGVEIDGYLNYLPQDVLEVVFAKGGAMEKLNYNMHYGYGGEFNQIKIEAETLGMNEYKITVNNKLWSKKPQKGDLGIIILNVLFFINQNGDKKIMVIVDGKDETNLFKEAVIQRYQKGNLKYMLKYLGDGTNYNKGGEMALTTLIENFSNGDAMGKLENKMKYSDGGKTNNKMKNKYFDEKETTVFQSKGYGGKNTINKLTLEFEKEYDNGFITSEIRDADSGHVYRNERIPISGEGIHKLYSMLDKLVNKMAFDRYYNVKYDKGGNTNMAEWIAVFMNPKEQNKVITVLVYGNSITEALKSAVISTFFLDISRDYELINIYAVKGSRRTDTNYAWGVGYAKGGKIGFKALAEKVAKRYEGTNVPRKYQSEYGKRYDRAEAREVGNKVAAKVYRQQQGKMAIGGRTGSVKPYPKIKADVNVIE